MRKEEPTAREETKLYLYGRNELRRSGTMYVFLAPERCTLRQVMSCAAEFARFFRKTREKPETAA